MRWVKSVPLAVVVLIVVLLASGVAATVWAQVGGGGAAGGGAAGRPSEDEPPSGGTIVIIKKVVPANDPQLFTFSGSGDIGVIYLDDDPNSDLPNTRRIAVPAGTYTVTEKAIKGWETSVACKDPDGGSKADGNIAGIDLDAGETVTCTFTNTKDVGAPAAPDLAITKKETSVSADGQAVTYTLTVTNIGTIPVMGLSVNDQLNSPPPGSQFVSATGSGSTGAGWNCTGAPGPGPVNCAYSGILAPNGILPPNDQPLTITIVVDVGPSGGVFSNCATVSHQSNAAVPPDRNLSNNQTCVKTEAKPVSYSCKVPFTTVFTAGVKDDFDPVANAPELSSPSTALAALMTGGTQDFDGNSRDRAFGHTFTGLPQGIVGATLEIGLRAVGGATNDSINLYMNSSNTFAWGGYISALTSTPPSGLSVSGLTGTSGTWTTGQSAVLTFDLAVVGSPTILSSINGNQTLDIYVQDDTAVDYIILTIETCPDTISPGTVVIIKDTVPDGPQDFEFTGSLGPFTLDNDGTPLNPYSNKQTFANLKPGTYTITEKAIEGWETSVACKDPDGGSKADGNIAGIDLDAGETVTCFFTNTEKPRPPTPPTYIYSVKLVCGTVTPPRPKPSIPTLRDPAPVVPGLYRTAVNIHNFWNEATAFQQKVAIALPQDQPRGSVTKLFDEKLGPNEAVEVDCYNVMAILEGTASAKAEFLKGFLVIESPVELEVIAVYTAEELQENGISIDVEQIQPHVIGQAGPVVAPAPSALRMEEVETSLGQVSTTR